MHCGLHNKAGGGWPAAGLYEALKQAAQPYRAARQQLFFPTRAQQGKKRFASLLPAPAPKAPKAAKPDKRAEAA